MRAEVSRRGPRRATDPVGFAISPCGHVIVRRNSGRIEVRQEQIQVVPSLHEGVHAVLLPFPFSGAGFRSAGNPSLSAKRAAVQAERGLAEEPLVAEGQAIRAQMAAEGAAERGMSPYAAASQRLRPAAAYERVTIDQGTFPVSVMKGKTKGVMLWENGELRLFSAEKGPGRFFTGRPGIHRYAPTHVEGHFSGFMHNRGMTYADWLISKNPCPICVRNVPRMLDEGAVATVIGPEGEVWTFIGGVPYT